MNLSTWAARWGIPPEALADLRQQLGIEPTDPCPEAGESEAAVQVRVRLEASRVGARLWRNNVGAGTIAETGSFVRWGLCNESKAMNERIKSSDLIGIRPELITPDHVGHVFGRFIAREVKARGWVYRGTKHEEAQLRFGEIVTSLGGDFAFTTGEGTL